MVESGGTGYPSAMPRIGPKRAVSVSITDFRPYEQDLLRAAWEADLPLVLVGFKEADWPCYVIAIGHADGLATAEASPDNSRIFSLKRIRGIDKPREETQVILPFQ